MTRDEWRGTNDEGRGPPNPRRGTSGKREWMGGVWVMGGVGAVGAVGGMGLRGDCFVMWNERRCPKSFIYVGVCKTPVHNILQKSLIIRLVYFAKGTSRTGKKLWQRCEPHGQGIGDANFVKQFWLTIILIISEEWGTLALRFILVWGDRRGHCSSFVGILPNNRCRIHHKLPPKLYCYLWLLL